MIGPQGDARKVTRHALMRRRAGDYLGLSDDLTTLWRIRSYEEDGSAVRGSWPSERPITGTFWQVAYLTSDHNYEGTPLVERDEDGRITAMRHPKDEDAWSASDWTVWADTLDRRRDALAELGR